MLTLALGFQFVWDTDTNLDIDQRQIESYGFNSDVIRHKQVSDWMLHLCSGLVCSTNRTASTSLYNLGREGQICGSIFLARMARCQQSRQGDHSGSRIGITDGVDCNTAGKTAGITRMFDCTATGEVREPAKTIINKKKCDLRLFSKELLGLISQQWLLTQRLCQQRREGWPRIKPLPFRSSS